MKIGPAVAAIRHTAPTSVQTRFRQDLIKICKRVFMLQRKRGGDRMEELQDKPANVTALEQYGKTMKARGMHARGEQAFEEAHRLRRAIEAAGFDLPRVVWAAVPTTSTVNRVSITREFIRRAP